LPGRNKFFEEDFMKKVLCGMAAVLAAIVVMGCATGVKEMYSGTVYDIAVPQAKNVEIIGLVHYEGVVNAGYGEKITYDNLLKEAEKIGGNGIVNILIDVKKEGRKFLWFTIPTTETWYGSALAIKYTNENLTESTTTVTEAGTVSSTSTPIAESGKSSTGGGAAGLSGLFKK
jgi:hypothetical protein